MGRVVVAVDLGTSRTAYATTHEGLEPEDIEVETPEGAGHVSVHDSKTPTDVLFDGDGQCVLSYGWTAEQDYAAQIDGVGLFFRRFKMALHRPSSDDPTIAAANGKVLKLAMVLAKALEYVKNHATRKLNQRKGLCIAATDVTWVLTVPAIWNDWAKAMMRTAAYDAGLIPGKQSMNLLFALEPECVSISAQTDEALGYSWDIGQKILILDCGGGTVDITAHQIADTSPLRLEELITPDGGNLGATKVDDRFYEFFEELIGKDRFQRLRKAAAFLPLIRSWEDRKVTFTGREAERQDDWCSHMSIADALLELEICSEELTKLVSHWNGQHPDKRVAVRGKAGLALSFNLMLSFFKEPVWKIVAKINSVISHNQALEGLNYVVVAGGFGRSPILIDRLRQHFEGTATRVVVSRDPDLAVVKGAAAFAARRNIIKSRKAKYTYGVYMSVEYNPKIPLHKRHEASKYLEMNGKWCLAVFSIHGRIGDDISVDRKPWRQQYYPASKDQEVITFRVLVTKAASVFLYSEPGVRELCRCDLKVNTSLPMDQRFIEVEFSFSGTETMCRFYRHNGGEFVLAQEMDVKFPSDVHWI